YIMLTPRSANGVLWSAATTNSGGGENGVAWTSPLPIGARTHVAMSYDFNAGTMRLYVNGQRVASANTVVPLRGISDVNVWLGRSNWPDPYFNGQIEEFRIYDGALSD